MPPAAGAGSGSGLLTTSASVVRTVDATEEAFWSAERVTFVGSTIPFSIMSDILLCVCVETVALLAGSLYLVDNNGAFKACVFSYLTNGSFKSLNYDCYACLFVAFYCVEKLAATSSITLTYAVPPPATMPSSTAARVALKERLRYGASFPSFRFRLPRRP